MVGNDILVYTRSGMDDQYIVPLTAAVNCMHALLVSPAGKFKSQRFDFLFLVNWEINYLIVKIILLQMNN
jgi:hypothetical protein